MLRTYTPLLAILGCTAAGLARARAAPTAMLDTAIVTGVAGDRTDSFLGIPFAQPPTGNLRFQVPRPLPPYNTSFSATEYGDSCPQQAQPPRFTDLLVPRNQLLGGESPEDCLTLNVITPSGIAYPGSKLSVVVWIYGGGFQIGETSLYNGGAIVRKSIDLLVPAVFVSMNFRSSAFGFLASKEVKDARVGNLGLRDQRLALRWVHKYISAFGGDPDKVTIWGESSGAISVALQMLTNGGNTGGLFRAAFMQSGAPIPVGDITHGQKYYDDLVQETGCTGSNNTLQCLRNVPFNILMGAVNKSPNLGAYQSLVLAWLPRVDEDFLTDIPQKLVEQGLVADIPFITGNCEDEGTLFAHASVLNITTNKTLADWLKTYWLPKAPDSTVKGVMDYYPQDPTLGSPFNTGDKYVLTPQYKRIAALMGDAVFQGPRRFFQRERSLKQPVWSYRWNRFKTFPIPEFGSFHGSDLLGLLVGFDLWNLDLYSYLLRFATHLDPNGGGSETDLLYWPQYHSGFGRNETMLLFTSGTPNKVLTTDTYRADPIQYLINVTLDNPL